MKSAYPSQVKILDNPERKATSRRAAVEFVARGIAEWAGEGSIRFKLDARTREEMHQRHDQQYWDSIARQRGGSTVFCDWKPRPSGHYTVMQASVGVDAR